MFEMDRRSWLKGAAATVALAPRAWAICMMSVSWVVPSGLMLERNRERPAPVLVEKNMSAKAGVQPPTKAEEPPNPSIS